MAHDPLNAILAIGDAIRNLLANPDKATLYQRILNENGWFTPENLDHALFHWQQLLQEKPLLQWIEKEAISSSQNPRNVGVIMAGNIPLVGLHDVVAVLITGNHAQVKCASNDTILLPYLVEEACKAVPELQNLVAWVERLSDADAVIATGSNNTARYFYQYFGHLPHIIRKNRNSVAVLSGFESEEALQLLKEDLIRYFGLGCRSVSHVIIPEDFDPTRILRMLDNELSLVHHHKYFNNFEYHYAIHLLNKVPHFTNNVVLMTENESLSSPLAMLHYTKYRNREHLDERLQLWKNQIQIILSDNGWYPGSIPFGQSQMPSLTDYADGINTVDFLKSL